MNLSKYKTNRKDDLANEGFFSDLQAHLDTPDPRLPALINRAWEHGYTGGLSKIVSLAEAMVLQL